MPLTVLITLRRRLIHSRPLLRLRTRVSALHTGHCVSSDGGDLPEDFCFFPEFLNKEEQRILLAFSLRQLDEHGSPRARRILKRKLKDKDVYSLDASAVVDMFLPEESGCYDFEEGHYDGVIQHFREMHVTSWPADAMLEKVLRRLRTLLPDTLPQSAILTHLLHLSSKGQILPHVDNVEASGSWIAAVSLGHPRVLRMEGPKSFDVLLPSGSAYVQKETVRYRYKHSVLLASAFKNSHIVPGPRLSVVLRDRLQSGLT